MVDFSRWASRVSRTSRMVARLTPIPVCLWLLAGWPSPTTAVGVPPVGPQGALTTVSTTIRDAAGGEVLLRGVNLNSLVQYSAAHPEAVPLGSGQVGLMAAMGFDVMRLALSLSALEPRPGFISPQYLRAVSSVVARARAHGLYVILDLHQDRYSAGLFPGESDGMPPFMVLTHGVPTRPLLLGITDPAVQEAFSSFWHNQAVDGRGLQDWYLIGLRALAQRFAHNPSVLGYDVMNEPNPGFILSGFVTGYLLPFYRQAIGDIRATGSRQLILLEPNVLSIALADALWPRRDLPASLANLVFAPHLYATAVAGGTSTALAEQAALADLSVHAASAQRQAIHLGIPWFIGEFGAGPGASGHAQIARDEELADRYQVGSAYWLWSIKPGTYPWNLVTPAGSLAASSNRLALVSAPYPVVSGGTILQLQYTPVRRTLVAAIDGARRDGPTVLVWTSLTYPGGASLTANRPYTVTLTSTRSGSTTITTWHAVIAATSGHILLRLSPRAG